MKQTPIANSQAPIANGGHLALTIAELEQEVARLTGCLAIAERLPALIAELEQEVARLTGCLEVLRGRLRRGESLKSGRAGIPAGDGGGQEPGVAGGPGG